MRFKYETLKEEFWQLDPKLRMILTVLDFMCIKRFKKEIILTSLIRPKTTDSGVHEAKRGADLRTIDYFTPQEIETILEFINLDYPYDPVRPNMKTAIYHEVKETLKDKDTELSGLHIHIQTMQTV